MSRRIHLVAGFCLGLFASSSPTVAQTWTGTSSTSWATPGNWSGGVPGNNGKATFNTSTSRDPNIGSGTVQIGDLVFASGTDPETIAGSGTLLIHGTGGVGLLQTAGAKMSFTANAALGSTQTWATSGASSDLDFNHLIDLAGYTLTVDIGAASTVAFSTGSGDVVSSSVAGGAIVKNGAGTLNFSGNVANTFDGGFTLNAGTVSIRNNASLGTGTLTLGGGTLSAAADKTIGNALVVAGNATLQGASGIDFTFSSSAISGTSGSLSVENASGSGTATTLNFSGSGFDLGSDIALGTATELRLRHASGTQTYSGVISGAGLVRQNVAGGTAVLGGANTFTGGVVIDAGTLSAATDSSFGTGTIDLSGGTLTSGTSRTLTNNLSLSGSSTVAGAAGVDFLFASNSIAGTSGTLTVDNTDDSGLMTLGFSGSGFAFARAISLSDASTELRSLNTTGTQTYSAAISGAGSLLRSGAGGTTVLSASNSYAGGTTFTDGTLALGGNSALGAGALAWSGGTLQSNGGTRSIANAVTLGGDGTLGGAANFTFTGGLTQTGADRTLLVTNTGVTTFSSGALALAENNQSRTLTFDVDTASGGVVVSGLIVDGAGTGADGLTKKGGGSLTLNGANTYTGATTLNAGTVVLGNNSAFGTGSVSLQGAGLSLSTDRTLANNFTLAGATTISGLGYSDLILSGGLTTTAGSLTLSNTDGSGTMSVGFSGAGFDFSRDISLSDAFTELRALHTAGSQTYSGVISGAGRFHQNGAGGTVTLAGANTFSGGVLVDAGTLSVGHDSALGTGALTLHGGTLFAATDRTLANDLALTANSSIAAASGANLVFTSSTVGGTSGILTLQNASGSGAASVGFAGAGFNFNRSIAFADADTTLRFANTSGTQTFSGTLSGAGMLVRSGAGGTTTLTGANSAYSGEVAIDAGTLAFSQNTSLGTGTVILGGGTLQTGGSSRSLANAVALTADSTLGGSGALALTGGLTQSGGDHTLAVTNTAATTLSGSALTLAENNQARTLTIDVAGTSGGLNIATTIQDGSGTGADGLAKTGLGQLTLSAANTFTGQVNVNAGTLVASITDAFGGHNAVDLANGATLSFNTAATTNTLSGLTGGTPSTAGGIVSLAASATLIVDQTGADSFSGRLTGAGLFEKQGAGTFTFESPANTDSFAFAGEVKLSGGVAAGTLEFKGGLGTLNTSTNALSIGTLTLTGGSLVLTNAYLNVGTLNITGDTVLDFGTSGRSILNAANVYIATGAVLTVLNWSSEVDFLFANSDFRADSGSGQISIRNESGVGGAYAPENQVWFAGDPLSADGSHTTWIDNATNFYDYANYQVRPVPEPSAYGAGLIAGCLVLLGWRRFRRPPRRAP